MQKFLFEKMGGTYRQEGAIERLKKENQMEWVGKMNNIRGRIEEIIIEELILA